MISREKKRSTILKRTYTGALQDAAAVTSSNRKWLPQLAPDRHRVLLGVAVDQCVEFEKSSFYQMMTLNMCHLFSRVLSDQFILLLL